MIARMKTDPLPSQPPEADVIHEHFINQRHESVGQQYVRYHAFSIADDIAGKIQSRRLDPRNVLVLFGEDHDSLSHKLSEIWTIERLRRYYPQLSVCIEYDTKNKRVRIPKEDRRKDWLKTAATFAESRKSPLASLLVPAYCDSHQIACHPIDLSVSAFYSKKKDKIHPLLHGRLPDHVTARYRNDPAYQEHLENYPNLLRNPGSWSIHNRYIFLPYIDAMDADGMLRRDMFMSDRLSQLRRESQGPLLSINGRAHLFDDTDRMPNTLLEMALTNGHDVFAVNQEINSFLELDPKDIERTEAFLSFLNKEKSMRLHTLYHTYHKNLHDVSYSQMYENSYMARKYDPALTRQAAEDARDLVKSQKKFPEPYRVRDERIEKAYFETGCEKAREYMVSFDHRKKFPKYRSARI